MDFELTDEPSLVITIEEIARACASTADILDSAAIIGIIPIYRYLPEISDIPVRKEFL